jgi:hypothetical protein
MLLQEYWRKNLYRREGGRPLRFKFYIRDMPTGTDITYGAAFEFNCASEGAYSDCSVNGAFQRHKLQKIYVKS